MKKLLAVLMTACMLMSVLAVLPVSADEPADLPVLSVFYYSGEKSPADKTSGMIDGVIGNNKASKSDWTWCDKSAFTMYEKNTEIPYKETVTGNTATYDENYKTVTDIVTEDLKLTDGSTYKYWYSVEVALDKVCTVNSFRLYFHGYKPGILDMNFAIFVSSDGETWKMVKEAGKLEDLVNKDGLLTDEGVAEYHGAVNTVGAAATEDVDCAYLEWVPDVAEENVLYIRYATNKTRYNNAYYTMRFTEVSVKGTVTEVETTAEETTAAATEAPVTTEAPATEAETTVAATEAEATEAPATETPATEAPAGTEAATEPAKKGCGSSVCLIALLPVASLAVLAFRKKED